MHDLDLVAVNRLESGTRERDHVLGNLHDDHLGDLGLIRDGVRDHADTETGNEHDTFGLVDEVLVVANFVGGVRHHHGAATHQAGVFARGNVPGTKALELLARDGEALDAVISRRASGEETRDLVGVLVAHAQQYTYILVGVKSLGN